MTVTMMSAFTTVKTAGAVLPSDALARAVNLRMPGQSPADYQLVPGQTVNAAVARAWDQCLLAHRDWSAALDTLPADDPAVAVTRSRWLLRLLYELGHGKPEALRQGIEAPPGLGQTEPERFPISHRVTWPDGVVPPEAGVPIHLVGAGVDLDTRPSKSAPRSPQATVQEFLNRHPRYLWGIVSNGRTLRVLRDASSLARRAHVEFDLDDMFSNQRYADFRLLFLTVHASRFAPAAAEPDTGADEPDGEDAVAAPTLSAETCLLEQWRTAAISDGSRALAALRLGVARAMEILGTDFVANPANSDLRQTLAAAPDADADLRRALLRVAYRLIVLFVAEDRDQLHPPSADGAARSRYAAYFSTARLRRLAGSRAGTRHTDLWAAHLLVTDALAGDGEPLLGMPGLAASLFDRGSLGVLAEAKLSNRALLGAVRELAQIVDPATGVTRPVDYRNLDSEELGGVYEGLLAYVPRYDSQLRTFALEEAPGNDRKKSGSYYTPSALIALVLDEALDPLIAEARRAPDPEAALLSLTVLDPAVGSGHFVVAAARRIAAALATIRAHDPEPAPAVVREATADVIARCVFGVDVNDLAIEITKVALWLEAFDGSRPLPFLDAHFKVGNALLGTTPTLLADGVPDTAFKVLTGDESAWTAKLKARNKAERARSKNQLTLDTGAFGIGTTELAKRAHELDDQPTTTLAQTRARADAWRRFDHDPELATRRFAADTWCSAFVQPKTEADVPGITHATLRRVLDDPADLPPRIRETVQQQASRYRFFHWHLEFPTIFTVPEPGTGDDDVDPVTGWRGGFSCVLGNPPWESVQLEDKQFFAAAGRPDIVNAGTAAIRTEMINALAHEDPDLAAAYLDARRESDATTHLVRGGRFPLTATGKINTYSVFAETFRMVTAPDGTAGIVTPTGLATDKTTSRFFGDTLESKRLLAFYDFENEAKIFSEVHHAYHFAVTAMSGVERIALQTRFAFLTRHLADVPERRFELSPDEVMAMNPNTGTLPMFRTRADADITLGIYRKHPVLVRDGAFDGNAWKLSFSQGLFNMASDSSLFHQPEDMAAAEFDGWSYHRGGREYLPLYEAKMLGHFDHRFSTYRDVTQAQLNVGSLPRPSAAQHDDPDMEPLARYWVARSAVQRELLNRWDRDWLLGWRDIARASDMRTFVPAVLPTSAVGHVFPLAFPNEPAHGPLLHAVWSSLVFDYVTRQKLSGTHMTYSVVKQLACPTPATFEEPAPWQPDRSLARWVLPYVRELSYTSWRLRPYAREIGDDAEPGPPYRWDLERRDLLRADLDAAFLHVYGLTRPEAEHVLDSFFVVRKYEERDHGEYRTRRLVLEAYDRMAVAAARGGAGWEPLADPPAGAGHHHPTDSSSNGDVSEK